MTLQRISDEELVARWGAHPTTGNVKVYATIAQAQLEADLEAHKAVIRRLIAEVKYITNREELDEHLKQKYEVSDEWGYVL